MSRKANAPETAEEAMDKILGTSFGRIRNYIDVIRRQRQRILQTLQDEKYIGLDSCPETVRDLHRKFEDESKELQGLAFNSVNRLPAAAQDRCATWVQKLREKHEEL